jgi:hypothetical protein
MSLSEWRQRWNLPHDAIDELAALSMHLAEDNNGNAENMIQAQMRINAARSGRYLWRNNVGAGLLKNGSFVRWGLANDSAALNARCKSADLIGLEKVLITPEMVGTIIGRFLSVECKKAAWRYSGTLEENAQLAWATLVNSQGGRAIITNDPASVLTDTTSAT